jgi:hypothetical protein
MSCETLTGAIKCLDGLVRQYWGMPLLVTDGDATASSGDGLRWLLSRLPETGFGLNIGGNSFELVGRRHIEQIQYQFADVERVGETDAMVFVTQQDFNAVFVEQRGAGAVWGGLAGGEYSRFGESLSAFFGCIADCFEIAHTGSEGLDDGKLSAIRNAVRRNEGADVDAWMEYFYG